MVPSEYITLAHGSGGVAMADLIESVFKPIFDNQWLNEGEDQARLSLADYQQAGDRIGMTTDSFVISPIEFPGGDIGKLAVCGTLNDLAVGGAIPKHLSVSFILEEGLPIQTLKRIVHSMQYVAEQEGVAVVTGDTKVVPKGSADKIFINTTAIGVIPSDRTLGGRLIQPGDAVIVNGQIGNHGAAIADVRDSLGFISGLQSDCACLNGLIQTVLNQFSGVRCIRDATRGGVAAVANEFAKACQQSIAIHETNLPVNESVKAICELLGFDPLYLANEGNALWVVDAAIKDDVVALMRSHQNGTHAAVIGEVSVPTQAPLVTSVNGLGASRIIDLPMGELLPRIC